MEPPQVRTAMTAVAQDDQKPILPKAPRLVEISSELTITFSPL